MMMVVMLLMLSLIAQDLLSSDALSSDCTTARSAVGGQCKLHRGFPNWLPSLRVALSDGIDVTDGVSAGGVPCRRVIIVK